MDNREVRRKILKGSLAAPVVLTVSSASAQAITSFGKCLGNLAGQQPTTFFTQSADTWFRVQVPVAEIFKGSQSLGTYYFDPMVGRYVNVVYPYAAIADFAGSTFPNASYRFGATSARWALVYFDSRTTTPYSDLTGKTIVTLQKPSGYLASSISCYGSFARSL